MASTRPEDLEMMECRYCKNEIPPANIQMHELHCKRHLRVCDKCGETVPINCLDEHEEMEHREVPCRLCSLPIAKDKLLRHMEYDCRQRRVLCSYCDLKYPYVEFHEHEQACGARTDVCDKCLKTVMLKNMLLHRSSECKTHIIEKSRPTPKPREPMPFDPYGQYDDYDDPYMQNYPQYNAPATRYGSSHRGLRKVNNMDANISNSAPVLYAQPRPTKREARQSPASESVSQSANESESQSGGQNTEVSVGEQLELPCEFCEELIPFASLEEHQNTCTAGEPPLLFYMNPSRSVSGTRGAPAVPRATQAPREREAYSNENISQENISPNNNYYGTNNQVSRMSPRRVNNEVNPEFSQSPVNQHSRRSNIHPLEALLRGAFSRGSGNPPSANSRNPFHPPSGNSRGYVDPPSAYSRGSNYRPTQHDDMTNEEPPPPPPYPGSNEEALVPTEFYHDPNCPCGKGQHPPDIDDEEFVECSICQFPIAIRYLADHEYYCQLKKEGGSSSSAPAYPARSFLLVKAFFPGPADDRRGEHPSRPALPASRNPLDSNTSRTPHTSYDDEVLYNNNYGQSSNRQVTFPNEPAYTISDEDRIPCNYCGQVFSRDELADHEELCDENEPQTLVPGMSDVEQRRIIADNSASVPSQRPGRGDHDMRRQLSGESGYSGVVIYSSAAEYKDANFESGDYTPPGILDEHWTGDRGTDSRAYRYDSGDELEPPTSSRTRTSANANSGELKFPCEFCEEEFTGDELDQHEDICEANDFRTIIPVTSRDQLTRRSVDGSVGKANRISERADDEDEIKRGQLQAGNKNKGRDKNVKEHKEARTKNGEETFPCEFCGEEFPSDEVYWHEEACEANDFRTIIPVTSADQLEKRTADGSVGKASRTSELADEDEVERGQLPAGSKGKGRDKTVKESGDTNSEEEKLPCEFCSEEFPLADLMNHQILRCPQFSLRPTAEDPADNQFKRQVADNSASRETNPSYYDQYDDDDATRGQLSSRSRNTGVDSGTYLLDRPSTTSRRQYALTTPTISPIDTTKILTNEPEDVISEEEQLPCEFCGQEYPLKLLMEHQLTCPEYSPQSVAKFPSDDQLMGQVADKPENKANRPSERGDLTDYDDLKRRQLPRKSKYKRASLLSPSADYKDDEFKSSDYTSLGRLDEHQTRDRGIGSGAYRQDSGLPFSSRQFDSTANSPVDRPASSLTARLRTSVNDPDDTNAGRPQLPRLPCEFCGEEFTTDLLMSHQMYCRKNLLRTSTTPPSSVVGRREDDDSIISKPGRISTHKDRDGDDKHDDDDDFIIGRSRERGLGDGAYWLDSGLTASTTTSSISPDRILTSVSEPDNTVHEEVTFPCEFCSEEFTTDELMGHQIYCPKNSMRTTTSPLSSLEGRRRAAGLGSSADYKDDELKSGDYTSLGRLDEHQTRDRGIDSRVYRQDSGPIASRRQFDSMISSSSSLGKLVKHTRTAGEEKLPCEFCNEEFPADKLAFHQCDCPANLTRTVMAADDTAKSANRASERTSRGDDVDEVGDHYRIDSRVYSMDSGPPVSKSQRDSIGSKSSLDRSTSLPFSTHGEERLPCEFCKQMFPNEELTFHQVCCPEYLLQTATSLPSNIDGRRRDAGSSFTRDYRSAERLGETGVDGMAYREDSGSMSLSSTLGEEKSRCEYCKKEFPADEITVHEYSECPDMLAGASRYSDSSVSRASEVAYGGDEVKRRQLSDKHEYMEWEDERLSPPTDRLLLMAIGDERLHVDAPAPSSRGSTSAIGVAGADAAVTQMFNNQETILCQHCGKDCVIDLLAAHEEVCAYDHVATGGCHPGKSTSVDDKLTKTKTSTSATARGQTSVRPRSRRTVNKVSNSDRRSQGPAAKPRTPKQ